MTDPAREFREYLRRSSELLEDQIRIGEGMVAYLKAKQAETGVLAAGLPKKPVMELTRAEQMLRGDKDRLVLLKEQLSAFDD